MGHDLKMTTPKQPEILAGHRPAKGATIFGDGSPIDHHLVDQLGCLGLEASIITVPIGWPGGVELAVVRLDTASGQDALRDLATQELPATRAICICPHPQSLDEARAIRDLSIDCSNRNLITLLWHPTVGASTKGRYPGKRRHDIRPDDLALVVARELVNFGRPHFLEQTVVLDDIGRAN